MDPSCPRAILTKNLLPESVSYRCEVAQELWPMYFSAVTLPAPRFCSIQWPIAPLALQGPTPCI